MALVIKRWSVSETAGQNGEFINIHGREAGLLSFILSLLGVDPTTTFIVDAKSVRLEQGSLAGFERSVTPIPHVSTASFGYKKPWKMALIITVILGFVLFFIPLFGQLIAVLIGLAYYFLKKELFIRYYAAGSVEGKIEFKRSLIEGQNIDERAGERIVAIIEMLVLGQDKPRALSVDAGAGASGGVDVGEEARKKMDALKGQAMRAGERAASKVAASLASASENMSRAASAPEPKCPGCGEKIAADDTFCGHCGRALR